MNFEQTTEFKKELKKFVKKWRHIDSDLETLKKVVVTLYEGGDGVPAEHIRESFFANKKAAVLQTISKTVEVVKLRMDSTDLNKNILRVVYIRADETILFIELYAKNEKPREDTARWKIYVRTVY